ncbi:VCBS repeat-containing protein [Saccharopolyspora sp. HNM0983]|uniref:VCBS repeat-containing protein n=1 Tax=Saccharopolyspora montiporae TaxID=2781240 RepID=A0A929BDE2_9PSEU|nr:VCBS repeat-containing protein [Saccharopolyspora sp. HNM0983]
MVGLTAAALALATAAPAAAQQPAVHADLDGDGRPDAVSLVQVSESTMLLRAGMAEEVLDVEVPGNARGTPPVPVDVNGDGRAEVLVPESVGANTITRTAWAHSPEHGLVPLRGADDELWRLPEGGGAGAVSTYGCTGRGAGAVLDAVSAARNEQGTFDGGLRTYRVAAGAVHLLREVPIRGADREDEVFGRDPAECAPAPNQS